MTPVNTPTSLDRTYLYTTDTDVNPQSTPLRLGSVDTLTNNLHTTNIDVNPQSTTLVQHNMPTLPTSNIPDNPSQLAHSSR